MGSPVSGEGKGRAAPGGPSEVPTSYANDLIGEEISAHNAGKQIRGAACKYPHFALSYARFSALIGTRQGTCRRDRTGCTRVDRGAP